MLQSEFIVQSYCVKKGRKLFACFVDFEKAFDSLHRKLPFDKRLTHGITGTFLNNANQILLAIIKISMMSH